MALLLRSRSPKLNKLLLQWFLTGVQFRNSVYLLFCYWQFEGPIQVLCCMMVDPNANIKKGSGKDLTVGKGEILEVIQQTNEKKVLCRNDQGKCECCAPSCEKHYNAVILIIIWVCFIYTCLTANITPYTVILFYCIFRWICSQTLPSTWVCDIL